MALDGIFGNLLHGFGTGVGIGRTLTRGGDGGRYFRVAVGIATTLGETTLAFARLAEQFRKEAAHYRSLNDSDYPAVLVGVRDRSCKPEIWCPDDFLLVAFPPNSRPTDAAGMFAHAGSVIRNQVVPVWIETVIVESHFRFGFFELPLELVRAEVGRMRANRF